MSNNNWISLNIPDKSLDQIMEVIRSIEDRVVSFKGYTRDELHMTFFYMGKHLQDMASEDIQEFQSYLKIFTNRSYSLNSDKVSYYPQPNGKNLVILFNCDNELIKDNTEFEKTMRSKGFKCSPFIPHITIGKVHAKKRVFLPEVNINIKYHSNNLKIDGKKLKK